MKTQRRLDRGRSEVRTSCLFLQSCAGKSILQQLLRVGAVQLGMPMWAPRV